MSVMLCLVGRQTLQNLLPILHYRPQRVFFLSTQEEDVSRIALEPVVRGLGIVCEPPIGIAAVCAQLRDRLQELRLRLWGAEDLPTLAAAMREAFA